MIVRKFASFSILAAALSMVLAGCVVRSGPARGGRVHGRTNHRHCHYRGGPRNREVCHTHPHNHPGHH